MVSSGVADAFGAVGGGVLAACLVPQLWKLWRTKSARDINLWFLVTYLLAMLVSFLYLFYEDALVGWVCVVIELACVALMIVFKLYYDFFGPNSWRSLRRARPEARLTTSPSLAAEVGLTVQDAGPSFSQLLRATPTHAAQHLLLDARLALPGRQASSAAANGVQTRSQPGKEEGNQKGNSRVLDLVGELLEAALADAGLPVSRTQAQAFASFRRQQAAPDTGSAAAAAEAEAEAAASPAPPDMVYLACRNGYATAVWHAGSNTLSLDMLAASDAAVPAIAQAAQALSERLLAEWPDTRIEASAVMRLQHPSAEERQLREGGTGEEEMKDAKED